MILLFFVLKNQKSKIHAPLSFREWGFVGRRYSSVRAEYLISNFRPAASSSVAVITLCSRWRAFRASGADSPSAALLRWDTLENSDRVRRCTATSQSRPVDGRRSDLDRFTRYFFRRPASVSIESSAIVTATGGGGGGGAEWLWKLSVKPAIQHDESIFMNIVFPVVYAVAKKTRKKREENKKKKVTPE